MDRKQALDIMKSEGLKRYNWFNDHDLKEDEVCIEQKEKQWIVYVTDERASAVTGSIFEFDTESEALQNFISRARAEKILFD